MANYVNGNINVVSLSSTILTQNYYPVRNILERIPPVYQTEELTKFFNSTVNYWFTPGNAETYNGYIGQLTDWYNPNTDNYITEPSSERQFYQLNPAVTIKNSTNDVTQAITYTDIVNSLRMEGVDVSNQDRLFSNKYWSWCPPIDINKFINYKDYYWVTDIDNYFILTGEQKKFYIKSSGLPDLDGYTSILHTQVSIPVTSNNFNIEINGTIVPSATYVVSEGFVTFNFDLNIGDKLSVIYQSDVSSDIIGMPSITPENFGLTQFNNEMRIKILNDVNYNYDNKIFVIEGVGESINFVDVDSVLDIIGQSIQYTSSNDNEYLIDASMYVSGMVKDNIRVYVNGTELPETYFDYDGVYTVTILIPLNSNSTVVLYSPSNISEYFNEYVTSLYGVNLKRNQIINIQNDINTEYNGLYTVTYNSGLFNITPYSALYNKDYMTIAYGKENPWSTVNRWTHKNNINVTIDSTYQATRPIIEFFNTIALYNYGTYRRVDVDFINKLKTDISTLTTPSSIGFIDGIRVDQEYITTNGGVVRVLITNDVSSDYNNKIISMYINASGTVSIMVDNDGVNQNGIPTSGEIVKVLSGNTYGGTELYYNGSSWVQAQSKGTYPLFNVYNESEVLQGSNSIFTYEIGSGSADSVLGFALSYNSDGNIEFNNSLNTGSTLLFYDNDGSFENSWYESSTTLRQKLYNRYTFDGIESSVEIACATYSTIEVKYVDIDATYAPYVSTLSSDQYSINGNILSLTFTPNDGDILIVETTCFDEPTFGFYEVPSSLQTNTDNKIVTEISYNECLDQFNSIINSSNWLTTTHDYTKGTDIILQTSDMMLLGLLTSDYSLDFINSAEYVKLEYTKYKNNFQKLVYDYTVNNKYKASATIAEMCQTVMSIMSQGKSKTSPFYNTGIGKTSTYTQETFIPLTPSMEGLYPVFLPEIVEDRSLPMKDNGCYQTFIKGHDGSLTLTFGDYTLSGSSITNVTYSSIDFVILEFENRIYNSISSSFKGTRPTSDYIQYRPGFYRNTIYSVSEYNAALRPFFEKWCSKNGLDYKTNNNRTSNTNMDNPFEWNWSHYTDINDMKLAGSFKGIYEYFFDTATPHTTPWEMLGFAYMPTWWTAEYGSAPYTSNNYKMWSDIANGYVREGARKGIQSLYVRSGMLDYLPVDEFGDLLPPASCGLVKQFTTLPSGNIALGNKAIDGWNNDWSFGDIGPVESMWRNSSEYAFAVIECFYKLKPASVINDLWDTTQSSDIFVSRLTHAEMYVDGETVNSTLISKTGINSWISNYLKSRGKNVSTYLGSKIRSLGVNLAHRMAGFTKDDSLTIYSDVYGEIPSENITNILHKGNISNPVYSGVYVVYRNNKYQIFGFDRVNAYFDYYDIDQNSSYSNVVTPNTTTPVYVSWTKNTYYNLNTIIMYKGNWYICSKAHTSSTIFEDIFWDKTNKPDINNSIYGKWYGTKDTTSRLVYGEYLGSIQDVIDFLNGLEKNYTTNGWVFSDTNFKDIANQFLSWANMNQYDGAFLALSPYASQATFSLNSGIVDELVYPTFEMYDIYGNTLDTFTEERSQTELTISASGIYYCRLSVSVLEHIIVLDNETIYGDKLYAPEINVMQDRLLVDGFKTSNWNGTLNAPGFIVTGNTIVPNFEKTVDNFRKYFDIETVDNGDIQEYARKNIGYAKKDYLTNLLVSDTNQFEFYQGMIKQKGTEESFSKLLRSTAISNNNNIQFSEEWAIRLGRYGALNSFKTLELTLSDTDINFDPQVITFNTLEIDNSYTFTQSFENNNTIVISNDSSDAELMTTSTITPSSVPTNTTTVDLDSITTSSIQLNVTSIDSGSGVVTIKLDDTVLINQYPLSSINNYLINRDVSGSKLYVTFIGNTNGKISLTINGYKNAIPTVTNTSTYLNINDVYDTSRNKLISRDSHWQWRYDTRENIVWDKKISKPTMPTAGYVNVDNIDYFANTTSDLESLYQTTMDATPSTVTDYSTTFTYNGTATNPSNVTTRVVPSINEKGYSRVNTINVNLTKPIPNNGVVFVIRTSTETIATITSNNLSVGDNITRPYTFLSLDNTQNSIFVDFEYQGLSAIGYDISGITVTIETEVFGVGSMQPSQSTWVYNDNGYWNTYKFQDTKLSIDEIFVPSWTGQGSVVALKTIPVDINTDDLVVISSSKSDGDSGDLDQFGYETFNIKTSNTRILDITTNSTGSYPLIQELADAGMIIDSITVNNTTALDSTLNPTIITIGTASNNESILNGVVPSSTFTPSNVMLYCDCLCENTETTPPTEGTSVLTSTSCFDSNGIINVDISNSSIIVGDDNTTVPVQITRTGDIFNTVTSVTITDGGTGYTETPTVSVNGASGYTATATISNGSVTSISITNTGGCSLPLDTTPTISITGGNGTGATATPNVTNIADVPTVVGWKYKDVTSSGDYIVGGTITFPVVDNSTGNDFWSQILNFTIPSFSSLSNQYEIEIYDVNDLGFTINNSSTTLTIYNTKANDTSYDLSTTGSKSFDIGTVQDNDNLVVYITNKGTTNIDCDIIVTVNYHYTNGFEIYNDGNAFVITDSSYGGSLMKWKKTRANTLETLITPDGGWSDGDYAHIDNNGNWVVYQYVSGAWVEYFAKVSNYIDNSILRSVSLFTDNANLTEKFNVFDPLQGLIPGNIETNVNYQSKIDPAKYNSINTNEKHYWSYAQVGKTWWDLSTTFFVDYTLYGLDYTRNHWGEVVPDCNVKVYEWVRSPVSPTDWTNYILSGTYNYNGFDTSPSGNVDSDSIPYTITSEWNSSINGYQDTYYFWVYNKSTLPEVFGRKMTCAQITNYIKNIKTLKEPYCALTYGNNLIIGNINRTIKTEDSVLKVEWYSDDIVNSDTVHSEWKIIREEDTINKIEEPVWSKFVSSMVGFQNLSSYEIHNGETLSAIMSGTTEVQLSNVNGLPAAGDIKISNYWFTYSSINGNTLYGFSNPNNLKLDKNQTTYSKNVISSEITVPDQSLTEFEQYGVETSPLQSMVPNVDGIPDRTVRQTLIEQINTILAATNYVDNVSNWNLVFKESQSVPSNYSQSVSSISALEGLTVTLGELVLVTANSTTNNMWILYEYNPYDGRANSYGYTVYDAQIWNMEQGYIWNYIDWYADGWSSDNTPQYVFATMSDKNSANIPDTTLLNGTLVQINQISNNDDRWIWQVYKDNIWTTVGIQNGTFELTDIFYNNSTVLTVDNYTIDDIALRDGSFELRFLLNNLDLIFTTQEMNEIFFASMRSIMNETNLYNDWLIKTSYMYIDGYQEQMLISEVKKESQFDNLIEYIEEVKPYHVKIRDYLIQYVPELEILTTHITDFDFPSNSGSILHPATISGTYGYTNNNSDDTLTVENNRPWSDWYENYSKPVTDITQWDANWNGVRRFNVTMYINNIGDTPYGWDSNTNPWDYNVQVYSGNRLISDLETMRKTYTIDTNNIVTVSRYYNLNELLTSSTFNSENIVYVELENTYYFFDGENWIEIKSGPWDKAPNHSAYDRVKSLYDPTATMNKDISTIIGSDYKGTIWYAGTFSDGDFGDYPFDWYGGFGDEQAYYTGDTDTLNTTANSGVYSGYINIGTTPYLSRDIDVVAPALDNYAVSVSGQDETGYGSDDIISWGGWFRDPEIAEGNTSELATLTVTSSVVMRIVEGNDKITFIKDYNDKWYVENSSNITPSIIGNDVMYNTGYSTIQTIELTDPSELYLTFDIDQTNIVEVKSDVVLYDGENYIQYGSDIEYIIPTITLSGKISNSIITFGEYTNAYESSSSIINSKSLYWVGNEVISAEYNSVNSDGNSVLYKINRYLMGTSIPQISKNAYNEITNADVVYASGSEIIPCNFDVTFDPQNNVGGYFKTDTGIGLYGITLVEI